jgi:hypothetical protein
MSHACSKIPRQVMMVSASLCAVTLLASAALAEPLKFRTQEIGTGFKVCYAVNLIDMNGDQRTDIVVVDSNRVVWFENPGWQMHTIIQDQTKLDNVCISPYDIDGDGRLDFALGADWRPADTRTGGTIQWLTAGASPADLWTVRAIGEEPTVHRMRWVDLDSDGRKELVVLPLFGRDTTKPDFAERGVRVLAYKVPKDPVRDRWVPEVLNEDLHVAHNFWPTDMDGDGQTELLVVSFEGVHMLKRQPSGKWTRTRIGEGNQTSSPNRGSSEIKRGRLASGADYIATIEPWHGNQVVAYTRPASGSAAGALWPRQVIDEELKWGHAVWCANLDADADEELIIGVRDNLDSKMPWGLRIYDPQNPAGTKWQRQIVDPGGVSIEDLAATDLDGDGRIDIVAVGRHSHNVRIYWNEAPN